MKTSPLWVIVRGAGDLASGVIFRLHRSGLQVMVTELPQPLVVRRLASFAQAVFVGEHTVEGLTARRVVDLSGILETHQEGKIPVMVDPDLKSLDIIQQEVSTFIPIVLVDAVMAKVPSDINRTQVSLLISLGPGATAGKDCDAVVETKRGHFLGRVIWDGSAQVDTGIPEKIGNQDEDRVLRAPVDGVIQPMVDIGDHVEAGQKVAVVNGVEVCAEFPGVVRGILYPGTHIAQGVKIGDIDPRDDPRLCRLVSDKALAVGGGVLEAILSRVELRRFLWQ